MHIFDFLTQRHFRGGHTVSASQNNVMFLWICVRVREQHQCETISVQALKPRFIIVANMPPKGQPCQSVPVLPVDTSANHVILKGIDETVLVMKKHKILKYCFSDTDVLDIKEGGQLSPFDSATFKQAMAERNGASPDDYTYACLECASGLNYPATSTPGVRITQGQVERAIAQDFPDGKPFTRITRPFVVQVPDRKWDPQAHRGSWVLVSGIE